MMLYSSEEGDCIAYRNRDTETLVVLTEVDEGNSRATVCLTKTAVHLVDLDHRVPMRKGEENGHFAAVLHVLAITVVVVKLSLVQSSSRMEHDVVGANDAEETESDLEGAHLVPNAGQHAARPVDQFAKVVGHSAVAIQSAVAETVGLLQLALALLRIGDTLNHQAEKHDKRSHKMEDDIETVSVDQSAITDQSRQTIAQIQEGNDDPERNG